MHPKLIGDQTTLAVMYALSLTGRPILLPFGENTRYDLVLDDLGTLRRIQVKMGRLRKGAVVFATASTYGHHRDAAVTRRAYAGEVDAFGVYCPETRNVYLVPIDHVETHTTAALRVEPPANNQVRNVRWADDYVVAEVPQLQVVMAADPRRRKALLNGFPTAEPGATSGAGGSFA